MNAPYFRGVLWTVLLAAILPPPGGTAEDSSAALVVPVAGQPSRSWQDDSGYHSVHGALVGMGRNTVRILKENQRVTTVPLNRLSELDRAYVSRIHVVLKPSLPSVPRTGTEETSRTSLPPVSTDRHIVASITVSRDFLNSFMQNVDRTQPLTTTILGVPIRGWAHTKASARVLLIPHATMAVLEIPIRGQVASQTVGTASIAQIHSQSLTDFEKSVRVNLTEAGVTVEPMKLSTVNRYINSSVATSARARPGLVTRIANRRVQASKPAADQIARQQERHRINRAFESVAEESVGKLNKMLRELLRASGDSTLVRDSRLEFSTTDAALRVGVTTDDPPRELPSPPDVDRAIPMVVQLHSSVLVRAAQSDVATEMTERFQQLATGESAVIQSVRREMEAGKFATSWSEDETWLTITWQPNDVSADIGSRDAVVEAR